jgi:hypothetical protein
MAGRTRSNVGGMIFSGGSTYVDAAGAYVAPGVAKAIYNSTYFYMSDHTSKKPWPDNPLTMFKKKVVSSMDINGTRPHASTSWSEVFTNFNPSSWSNVSSIPTQTGNNPIDWAYLKTQALANINPNVASIDVGAFLTELREFPKMIHQLGRVLSRKIRAAEIAGGYLAYHFGWKPLIQDMMKLAKMTEIIDQRIKHLNNLGKGSVTRSLGGDSYPIVPTTQTILASTRANWPAFTGSASGIDERNFWYSAKTRLITKLPDLGQLRKDEFRRAIGEANSASTLWEILPWSWLVDYLTNFSDFLEAHAGGVQYSVDQICVMAKSTEYRQITPNPHPSLTGTTGRTSSEYKGRSVYVRPTPQLMLRPIWTNHMFLVLGSLFTSKALRAGGFYR